MVTGPMPRKPKATRPKAKTAGAVIGASSPRPCVADAVGDAHEGDDDEAHPVGAEVAGDEAGEDVERRAALARRGDDLLARGADSVEVKTLTSSGMIAPASVPQVMIVESFHQSVPSPPRSRDERGTRRRR